MFLVSDYIKSYQIHSVASASVAIYPDTINLLNVTEQATETLPRFAALGIRCFPQTETK